MKALVLHDCSTSAYVNGLKMYFPDWDVRGVLQTLGLDWIEGPERNDAFVRFMEEADVFVGPSLAGSKFQGLLSPRVRHVEIPPFRFRGLQPDSFHLAGYTSVLMAGNLFSRVAVTCFQAGRSRDETIASFRDETYQAFDYYPVFDDEVRAVCDVYRDRGIELSGSFERWLSRGPFTYSYNHPRIDVFLEILRRALVTHGFLPSDMLEKEHAEVVADDLADSIIWPVYPEVAARHGLAGSLTWRMGRVQGFRAFDLGEYVDATFAALTAEGARRLPPAPAWIERLPAVPAEDVTSPGGGRREVS